MTTEQIDPEGRDERTMQRDDAQLSRIEAKVDGVLVQNAHIEERHISLEAKVQKHEDKLYLYGDRLHAVEIDTSELGTASGKDTETFRGRWSMVWAVILLVVGAIVSQIVRLLSR